MENQRIPKKILDGKLYGKIPSDRWFDVVMAGARFFFRTRELRRLALDSEGWSKRMEEVRTRHWTIVC